MNILSIDPSVNNVGVAMLQLDEFKQIVKVRETTIQPVGNTLIAKAENLYKKIDKWLPDMVNFVVIEYPQFMMGQRGLISAQKGYTLDLAFICGYLASMLDSKAFLYTPMQWKGTKSKQATQAQYKRVLDYDYINEHSCDAAMLGYFFCKKANLLV